jgi:hypothetical protein
MSTRPPQRTLDDFVEFLARLTDAGIPFSIIGGCAVGVYARDLQQTVFSDDLDLCTTAEDLHRILALAGATEPRLTIGKRPQARGLQVAVLYWDNTLEINVLTGSDGLPPAEALIECSSE